MPCCNEKFMWKLGLVLILVLLACAPGSASTQPTTPDKPATEVAQNASTIIEPPRLQMEEKAFDFGEVNEGEIVRHDFKVKNTGVGELQITKVAPG